MGNRSQNHCVPCDRIKWFTSYSTLAARLFPTIMLTVTSGLYLRYSTDGLAGIGGVPLLLEYQRYQHLFPSRTYLIKKSEGLSVGVARLTC